MKQETLLPATAWYLVPEALAIIEAICADQNAASIKFEYHGRHREEYQLFEGPAVDALDAIYSEAFRIADASSETRRAFLRSGSVQDVVAAVLGTWLTGTHFNSDLPRLTGIAEALAGLRMECAA